ncbi:MAG: hypothetical protein ACE5NW_03615 [Acidiferrobacterales bacterium]
MIRQALVVLITVLLLTACASFQVIEPRAEAAQSKIKTGDTVRIVTIDGRTLELMALDVTPEALIGKDQATFEDRRVSLDEIAMLERKNRVKQDVLVYGSIAILFLVVSNNSGTVE